MSLIVASNVIKQFGTKNAPIKALGPVTFSIPEGSFTVILGRSGSGKSTLLNVMSGLDKITSGELTVGSHDLSHSSSSELAKYRAGIGIIFQSYNLLPNLNTIENVLMGGWAGGFNADPNDVKVLLEKLGLGHRMTADVKTLSGGERQRVAICRSLVGNPDILFCDEPTGALDSGNERQVEQILADLNQKEGKTVILVTHNPTFASIASQIIKMSDGLIEEVISQQI